MTIGGGDALDGAARAMVCDAASAALVAADGTVDWWCPGRFDATPVFTRLLEPSGACSRVGPWAPGRPPEGTQVYEDGSMVLVTRLAGRESLVEVTDLLPWDGGIPGGRLVRLVRVLRGPAEIVVDVVPAGDRRDIATWSEGMAFDRMMVRCGLPFSLSAVPPPSPARPLRRLVATASTVLGTGDGLVVTLGPIDDRSGALSLDEAARLATRTAIAWRRISATVTVTGPYAEAARRSALVVAALGGSGGRGAGVREPGAPASSAGAPVAAPTTSLPRVVGGERNTDGRVVWPTTAAAWATAAAGAGLHEQADAAAAWLAAALDNDPPLPAALSPDATAPPTQAHLPAIGGWRRSQPVVVGTNAGERISVEPTCGVIAAAASLSSQPAGAPLLASWGRVVAHADWLAANWSGPDASVWAHRGRRRSWVAARLATRDALAAAAASARRRNPLDLDAAGWQVGARDVDRWLLADGVAAGGVLRCAAASTAPGAGSESPGSGGGLWDAALVRVAHLGPWPPDDVVVRATIDRIIERNGQGPWIYPWPDDFDDGLAGTEPASVTATLWLARALASTGRWDEARDRMESVIALAGPLHLLPESVDATSGTGLGNRPASVAHIALLEAASALAQAPA